MVLTRRRYAASGGVEHFLSFETADKHTIHGFLRLRLTRANNLRRGGRSNGGGGGGGSGSAAAAATAADAEAEAEAQAAAGMAAVFPELHSAGLVRELHVYGQLVAAPGGSGGAAAVTAAAADGAGAGAVAAKSQHRGLGGALMREAEGIAWRAGCERMAVIAGVGARGYYRKLGYTLCERGRGGEGQGEGEGEGQGGGLGSGQGSGWAHHSARGSM